ncbi:hypothetical protein PENSPDRAFT_689498 [Peniophora sp. CONT]|nr:hypothetical protein PENSPDRAFT_689498 [Peniophora sp. CONT]
MLFTTVLAAASSLLGAAAAPSKRAPSGLCVQGVHDVEVQSPFVFPVARECCNDVPDGNSFWNTSICVAAVVGAGVTQLLDFADCYANLTIPLPAQEPDLDTNIWSVITGGQDNATSADLVNFVYSEIAAKKLSTYPDSRDSLATYYVNSIFTYLGVDPLESIGYDGFNQWLHLSGYANHYHVQ